MKSKTEQRLYSEIKASCENLNILYYKIVDTPVFTGNKMRFTQSKPFDIILTSDSNFCAIECKVHKKQTAWPISSVSVNQKESLWIWNLHGWKCFVWVNVRYGLGKTRQNFITSIPISYFFDETKEDKKSISITDLRNNFINLYWNSKIKTWSIDRFFDI